jgi:hypothetical protein
MDVCLEALRQHGWKQTETKWKPLPKRLDYHEAYRLARCLEIQLNALEVAVHSQSFIYLTVDDIRDIGSGWYIIHDITHMVPLHNNHITILTPIEKVKEAPEFAKDITLPYVAHKSGLYYHIGKMLVELLGVDDDLELLYGSPLYFTIKRSLDPDPTKRHFLIV